MFLRICWLTVICGSLFFTFHNCLSNVPDDGLAVDQFSIVELAEQTQKTNFEPRTRRLKRSSWSLPPNTSSRIVLDFITSPASLNNTFSAFTLDLIYRFVLPTFTQLSNLYSSLGRLDNNGELDEETAQNNYIDYEFFEEQRANRERRLVYQQAEGLFENFGFDGQTCLLRAICELAEAPITHHGLIGKLIDLIFTPNMIQVPKSMEPYLSGNRIRRDVTDIPELEVLQMPVEDDYTDAYRAGKEGKCWTRYYTCPISIFKLVNVS